VRIIRPLIYVRERALEDFSQQKSLPSRPSELLVRNNATNSILKVQETINPIVYDNLKLALKPLMACRLEKYANRSRE
jgi:tRNA(Ile)-lysidine synthase TilS/MesJ